MEFTILTRSTYTQIQWSGQLNTVYVYVHVYMCVYVCVCVCVCLYVCE